MRVIHPFPPSAGHGCVERRIGGHRTVLRAMTIRASALPLTLLVFVCCGGASTSAILACAPPRVTGDSAVHRTDLRVKNASCSVGRKVALACVRFTYGHS